MSLETDHPAFRALAGTLVPDAAGLDEDGWRRAGALIAEALDRRDPGVRRQLALFVRLADLLPLLRHGRTFRGLDPPARRAFLERLQNAPLLLLRRGLWGLRTLVLLGYYGQPEVARAVGWRAHPGGWQARTAGEARPAPSPGEDPGSSGREDLP